MKKRNRVKLMKARRFGFDLLKRLIGISIGSILMAISFNALIMPYGLLSGGVSGLALFGQYVFDIPVYFGILVLNVPVFIWGLKELNIKFIVYSLIGTLTFIIALPLMKPFIPVPELDIILVAIFAGILNGLGVGVVLKFGASGGGTDIISVIMKKKANIQVGSFTFAVNLIILLMSSFFFDLNKVLYTIVTIWVSGRVIDYVLQGIDRKKSIMIFSRKSEVIASRIIDELNRGITFINGEGGFKRKDQLIINTVVNNFENVKIRKIVEEVDKKAFLYITDAVEVSGKGFTFKKNGGNMFDDIY